MNLFFQAKPVKVVYKETLNGVLIVKFKVKNYSFKSTLSFETPFKKCLLLQYVQLISYLESTWSVHSFNGDYLSIPEGTGSCGYLFMKSPIFSSKFMLY